MQPFDAVLIHAYWLSQKGDKGEVKLSLRSHLAVLASSLFYHKGQGARVVVFTAGRIWGPNYPSLSALMAQELHEQYKVPSSHIVTSEEAINTKEEIDVFLKLAKENKWQNLADIAYESHFWTIPHFYEKRNQTFERLPIEDLILGLGSLEEQREIRSFANSFYERNYRLYQTVVSVLMSLDSDYRWLLGRLSHNYRAHKGGTSPFNFFTRFLPLDKYDL